MKNLGIVAIMAVVAGASLIGCGKKAEDSKAAAKVAEAQEKAGEAADKAGEAAAKAGEAAVAAGQAAKEAVKEAAAQAGEAAKIAQAAAKTAGEGAAVAAQAAAAVATGDAKNALMAPDKATERAPDTFTVTFQTTKGDFDLALTRDWAPKGVDRFYNLVKAGYFANVAFFRAIGGFMLQFGIHGDPKVSAAWRPARIQDDPVDSAKASNKIGYLTFAKGGPHTRTVQLFINVANNMNLDGMGFPPIGKVVGDGMKVVNAINTEYGEGAPAGRGPNQMTLQMRGNEYLKAEFPNLDYIKAIVLK